jgi:hypothetical protein
LIIRIERTGGFAGINKCTEMNTDDLPSSITNTINSIIKSKVSTLPGKKLVPKGAADHLNYKITIEDGNSNRVIECNQYDMDHKLKSLISYIEKKSKNRVFGV